MTDTLKIIWADVLEAYYGVALTDRQVEVWMSEMRICLNNLTNTEVCGAIRMAANEELKPIEYRATVRDVVKWLRIFRRAQKDKTTAEDREAIKAGFVSEWKEKMLRGAKRDDFICALDAAAEQWPFIKNNKVYNEIARQLLGN